MNTKIGAFENLSKGVFITPETRKKIDEAAEERSEKDIRQYAEDIYNELDKVLKMIAVINPDTKDYIIYTPERRIGKSWTLIRLANDYNAVILAASEYERNHLQHMAEDLGYEKQYIVSMQDLRRGLLGSKVRTIIKSETVKLADIRKQTSNYYIVGIEEV